MPRTPGVKELGPTLRARICEVHSIGWGYKQIHQKHPSISISTIRNTIKLESSRVNQHSYLRSGQPKKLTSRQEDELKKKVEGNEHIKMRELQESVNNSVSKRILQRLFRNMHKRKWMQRQRPEIQPIHAEKQLQWARMYASFTPMDWKKVIWSDECSVERGKGVRPVWT